MTNYSNVRELFIHDISSPNFPVEVDIANMILVTEGHRADLGSLAFRKRSRVSRTRTSIHNQVDLSSKEKSRIPVLKILVSSLAESVRLGELKPKTAFGTLHYIKQFFDWIDNNEIVDALVSPERARKTLSLFCGYVLERLRSGEIVQQTANVIQLTICKFIDLVFEDQSYYLLNRIPPAKNPLSGTEPPPEQSLGKLLSLCTMHFNGIANFVLDVLPYPYQLKLPSYLGWERDYLWIIPSTPPFQAPHAIKDGIARPITFNQVEGRLSTIEEMRALSSRKEPLDAHLRRELKIFEERIHTANADKYFHARISAADFAMGSFIVLFAAATGAPFSVIESLEWSEEYLSKSDVQGFKQVKFRAQNKLVSYNISSVFVDQLKLFCKLRDYLLKGTQYKYLFFGRTTTGKIRKLNWGDLDRHMDSLKRIDPDVPRILNRQLKAAKSDWLIRNTDIATTALVLQNTERTVQKHYVAGSPTTAAVELTNYFEKKKAVLREARSQFENAKASPLGNCQEEGNPKPIDHNDKSVQPDCVGEDGCLFCEKYFLHADEIDIRKLLSYQYVNQLSAHLSGGEDNHICVFKSINERVDELLRKIESSSDELLKLVAIVRKEVFDEGIVSEYWKERIDMLIELGVL